ncbi:MAG: DUF1320 domain-containing protein [Thermodesulfovibrionales bacterium]|nr:DUF1320 domain-containing protein [Thermodesulfovibrionales bacterium]
MPYCTLEDLKKALPEEHVREMTDDDGLGEIPGAVVSELIAQADAEIDLYLGRYSVPLSSVPDVIKRCSLDITTYRMYARRFEEVPDTRRAGYKDAIRTLEDIRDGKMLLSLVSTAFWDFATGVIETNHFGGDSA